jgi:ribosomal protein L4
MASKGTGVLELVLIVHLWKGGGVILTKPRTVILKLKERRLALQTLLYNKKNNILIIENLEMKLLNQTKKFLKICQDCDINLDKSISNCFKATPLKLSTQNLKNVELILLLI